MISDREKLACARRELAMRRRVYPRWVEAGRMTREEAEREIAVMDAIVADYELRVTPDPRQMGLAL